MKCIGGGTSGIEMEFIGGWGARDRTWECRNQNPVPYRLATPQYETLPLFFAPNTLEGQHDPESERFVTRPGVQSAMNLTA